MTLLNKVPPEAVHSLAELFAIAYALEEEASTRYRELAARMREHDALDTAAIFEHLAEEERSHRDQVTGWSVQRTGMAPKAADVRWDIPDTFDDEAAGELAGSWLATPYRALSMAVRNEERTFAFWTYVAAQADDAAIRQAAETMAREELEHVSLLRRERRHAYHAHRASVGQAVPRAASGRDILFATVALERRFAEHLDRLSTKQGIGDRERLREIAAESREMAAEIDSLAPPPVTRAISGTLAEPPGLMATAERLVERYLEAAEHAKNEGTLGEAQSLARKSITRLAWLRTLGIDAERRSAPSSNEKTEPTG